MKILRLIACTGLVFAGTGVACQAPVEDEALGEIRSEVIYGDDDREEPFTYSDPVWAQRVLEFTVALVSATATWMLLTVREAAPGEERTTAGPHPRGQALPSSSH